MALAPVAIPRSAALLNKTPMKNTPPSPGVPDVAASLATVEREVLRGEFSSAATPFFSGAKTYFARQLSPAQAFYLACLLPLDDDGMADVSAYDKIERFTAELLRLGLARDADGTLCFEASDDVTAFVTAPETKDLVLDAIIAIDAANGILPRRAPASGESEEGS